MARYCSLTSFTAKFCRLNQIKPKEFREFWYTSLQVDNINRKEERIRHIAMLLDEPLSIVSTVFGPTNMSWGHFSLGYKDNYWYDMIAYCPICLSIGYHGFFHEFRWLKQCPIHYVDMAIEYIGVGSGTRFDREVSELALLMDTKAPDWVVADGRWEVKASTNKSRQFQDFLKWYHGTQKLLTEWSSECLGIFSHHGLNSSFSVSYELQHIDLILGRLNWILPIPRQIERLFADKPFYKQPDIQLFNKEVASEFRTLQKRIDIRMLFDLYKLSHFVTGSPSPFQTTATISINLMESSHRHQGCECTWGKHPDYGWKRCHPGELRIYKEYKCPYDIAIMEMRTDCLGLLPLSFSKRKRHIEYYISLARFIANSGIVSITNSATEKKSHDYDYFHVPIVKFHWSPAMKHLADMLLVETTKSQMKELRHWLSAIEAGANPDSRKYSPPNIYLLQRGNSDMLMVAWPALGD